MPSFDDPILTPSALLAYRRANGQLPDFPPPQTLIFAPQKSLADYVLRKHSVSRIKGFLGEFYLLKKSAGRVALSTNFGIGAPVVAGLTDEFAALGVRQFVLIGLAGGLQENLTAGSLILSAGSIRGEGVTRHYLPPGEIVESSVELSNRIDLVLSQKNINRRTGLTWTTDAPFRELRREVLTYQKRGILAVEMESAGMLAVAKSYGLAACALFSVADTLANGIWSMSKDLRLAQASLGVLFDAAYESLA